jgi:mannose-6-phosphate isomerase-like protein (cupin superfamily)
VPFGEVVNHEEEGAMETQKGDGWSAGDLDGIGEGPGFRKVRRALGVDAFGVNALVIPPGYASGRHLHEQQEELYFVHRGEAEFTFDREHTVRLGAGGLARVDPSTVREYRNVSDSEDLVLLVVGGKGGYVGRDGRVPEGEQARPGGPPGAA